MGTGPRNYTEQTLKKLFALSGNQCAFPTCVAVLVNEKNALNSNICHIEAANSGGERFNINQSDTERADYNNLIILCPQHHSETNDVSKYTVEVLKEMKKNHEIKFLHTRIRSNPSMLINAISALSSFELTSENETESLKSFDPKNKINYNSIKRNVSLIEEYKVYYEKINSLYDELEIQGSIKKEKLLSNIRLIYTIIKGKYINDSNNPIEIIRLNSDNIIDEVYDNLYKQIEGTNMFEEDLVLAIRLIMVDAFIRCKILEEPR